MRALLACALVLLPFLGQAEVLRGRGVYYVDGPLPTPLGTVGTRSRFAATRIALDDDFTTVEVDREARRLMFRNTRRYESPQVVGDVVLLGVGTTRAGLWVPVTSHLELTKKKDQTSPSIHQHPTVPDAVESVRFDPWRVEVDDGRGPIVAMTPEGAEAAVRSPSMGYRLASLFIQAVDSAGPDPRVAADVTFSIGIGGLSKKLVRARISSIGGPIDLRQSLEEVLRSGSWELQIIAQSDLGPEEFRRDFFLVGMEGISALEPLVRSGLAAGDAFVVRLRQGRGTVFCGGRQAPLPNALDVARAYLEYTGVGALLAQQARGRVRARDEYAVGTGH